jgi:hypothetical protein
LTIAKVYGPLIPRKILKYVCFDEKCLWVIFAQIHLLTLAKPDQWLQKPLESRVARFFFYNIPKRGNIYQITKKYTKWQYNLPPCNLPNGIKIQISTSSTARPYKSYPNWDFLGLKIPSGNPVREFFR